MAMDRPYESFGDIDGWSGPTKADIRRQKQHDQLAQAAQATADRLLASGYRPSYALDRSAPARLQSAVRAHPLTERRVK